MSLNDNKILLDFSSSPFKKADGDANLILCRKAAESYGFEFGVQLHNTADSDEVDKLADAGVRLSAHAPLVADYAINLAAESFDPALKLIEENSELFRKLGIKETVFHGFGMTDELIPMFGREFLMTNACRKYFARNFL